MTITVREFSILPAETVETYELILRGSRDELLGLLIDVATPAHATPAAPADESGQGSGFEVAEEEEEEEEEEEIKAGDWVKFKDNQRDYIKHFELDPGAAYKVIQIRHGIAYLDTSEPGRNFYLWRLDKVVAKS